MENPVVPTDPRSNVQKVDSYDPAKYELNKVSLTVLTDEALTPGRPPCLTQSTIGMYLRPLTKELDEQPPKPTIAELPDAVIDRMVKRNKAFWIDKPGSNAYVLHDAFYQYGMTTEKVTPSHQEVFPRSYQYDLDCVKFRRKYACDLSQGPPTKQLAPYCRDCTKKSRALTLFELALVQDSTQKRWKYYPDLKAKMSREQIQKLMQEVGKPYRSEACNWYNKNYPSAQYDMVIRKFAK